MPNKSIYIKKEDEANFDYAAKHMKYYKDTSIGDFLMTHVKKYLKKETVERDGISQGAKQ